MATEREKMYLALDAKKLMLIHFRKGLKMFKELFAQYGPDGMFYFNRGEGYEHWQKYEKAKKDFQNAETLFYQEVWRQRAREGISRCELKLSIK